MATREKKLTAEAMISLHNMLMLEDLQQNGRGQIIFTCLSFPQSVRNLESFTKEVLDEMQHYEPDLVGISWVSVVVPNPHGTGEPRIRYKVVIQI